jgi:hypothetical protein
MSKSYSLRLFNCVLFNVSKLEKSTTDLAVVPIIIVEVPLLVF